MPHTICFISITFLSWYRMYCALWNSSWIYCSDKYSVSLYVILYYTCKRLCSVLKCFLHSMHQLEIGIMLVLLCHSKSAACVISIISSMRLLWLCRSCTPKQIDLQVFLLLQLSYCVSVLLLTSRCNKRM